MAARMKAQGDEYPRAFAASVISCSSASLKRRVILQVFRATFTSKLLADKWRTHHRVCLPAKVAENANDNAHAGGRESDNSFMFHYGVFAAFDHGVAPHKLKLSETFRNFQMLHRSESQN